MTSVKERDDFDEIFERVLKSLPEEVQQHLDEIAIIIEDEPSREILADMGIEARPGEADLCGLHSGRPLSERSVFDEEGAPTQIYLFRGPILRLAGYKKRPLEREIHVTLLHELGHFFGFDEEKLTELGYD